MGPRCRVCNLMPANICPGGSRLKKKKRSFLTFLQHTAAQGLVYLNHTYERDRAFPHRGLCSLQALVGRRGALLGLCMMIVQDAYNLPSAIGLICNL